MSELDVGILKQEILSLLVSAKYGLSEQELVNDYRLFNSNRDLPYRDLGYPSLIALLRSWPDVCRFQQQGNNGAIRILAVEEESTKHILSMVKGQRQGKSRRRGRGGRNRNRGGGEGRNGASDNRGARFSQGSFSSNNNRSGGNGRGGFNGRLSYNNNRSERSMAPPRRSMGQSNHNSRGRSNGSTGSRFFKQQQQQQIRSYLTGSSQSSMSSYDSRQPTNPNFFDDRRVINNSASIRITVSNNGTNNRHKDTNENNHEGYYSPDPQFQLSEYELNENGDQYEEEEEEDDKEEEVINNLQNLLREYSHGIRLLALDELYQKKFGKNLLTELKLANILLLQDYVDDFASISRQGEENGSCDHIITLKDPKQVAQTQAQLLQQITNSGIVPESFRYANNLFSYINDSRFQGFISNIDKNEHCLHVQPVRYQEHIETLMEELDSYYSSPISNSLIINNITTGLSCVTKYDGLYHRVFIKESDLYKCVLIYIDYGTTEEITKDDQQFKYLLNHFAELPHMAIACRLDDIYFLPDDNHWSTNTYQEVYTLCQHGPFFIEPTGYLNGLLTIKILDADERSLNDIVVELKLAMKISTIPQRSQQEQQNAPQPVALTFDCLTNAVQCPLPDSNPSTPDSTTENSNFTLSINSSSQTASNSSNIDRQYKLIQIDGKTSFYLIRHDNNKPYIPCFNLARLLNLSESDILSETLLPRIQFSQTSENRAIFDCLKQTTDQSGCLHIHQNFLFIFDLTLILTYIKQHGPKTPNHHVLIETLHQQIDASNESQFWTNVYDCYKRPTPVLSIQSSNQNDIERCNELLVRRNILCNMFRTNDINESTLELESIENELQKLIEKMRLGSTSERNSQTFSPPGFPMSDQQHSMINKTDKLRELMQCCKKLINTILVLDDYVPTDENVTKYIQENLSFLNSSKNAFQDNRLYEHYSELLQNLTVIVDNLRRQLPNGVNV